MMRCPSFSLAADVLQSVATLPDLLLEKVRPTRPFDFLRAQAESFADLLPYEGFLALDRPVCLLSDGSLGLVWELTPLPHEVMEHEDLTRRVEIVSEIFQKMRAERVACQVIFDAEPSQDFPVPANIQNPKTAAEKTLAQRVSALSALAQESKHRLRLMKRRVFLTLRLENSKKISSRSLLGKHKSEWEAETAALSELSQKLKQLGDEVEYSLAHAGIPFQIMDGVSFLNLLRATFHSSEFRKIAPLAASDGDDIGASLRRKILRDFVEVTPHAVGVGGDSWEVSSWIDQPPTVYNGLFARLIELDVHHRLVINIRTCSDLGDLETKKTLLKNATDSFGELQREEVKATQDRLARGENLSFVSVHLLIRNSGLSVAEVQEKGKAKTFLSQLKTLTQISFIVEKYAAPALFLMSLPLGYNEAAAGFSGREKRVLSRNIAPYLPIFGGFQGSRTPLQLMVSRGGDAVWLNPFDSETSAHIAVLASSGGGKSFFAQNLMMSFFAKDWASEKHPLLFIIDKKTSYEIFAQTIGEDVGSQIVKPPEFFPNIFRGKIDEYRLPVIVGILKTAVSLVSEDSSIGAIEEMVLNAAVRATFEQNELDARTEYVEGSLREKSIDKVRIPRLSDVLDNLFPVCAKSGVPAAVASTLAGYLSPFVGNGPYASLFDREEFETFDPQTPGISLFDIDAVSSHPVLSTLTTQMILSEILRQIRRPENRGRPGMLVIEEAGVLAGGSSELVLFIQDAWKTFRKLGFSCVGLTNEVDDYARKPGPREIWNVSPNKIILRMLEKDIQKALSGNREGGFPPLIEDAHIGKLISSLSKKDGAYSQGLWWSDEAKGTFVFIPTGFDYWCAASKPTEVETVYAVRERLGAYPGAFFDAVSWLAENFPLGVRNGEGGLRRLNDEELRSLKGKRI